MLVYIIYLSCFAVLFIISKGFFTKSALFIKGRIKAASHLSTKHLSLCIALLFLSAFPGLILNITGAADGTVRDGYLLRNDQGAGAYEETLNVSVDGRGYTFDIDVADVRFTERQVLEILQKAEGDLVTLINENFDISHIDKDMELPSSVPGSPVEISWATYSPGYLDWDGTLGEDIPEEGAAVKAEAGLSLQGTTLTVPFEFKVYPRKLSGDEQVISLLKKTINETNPETEKKMILPGSLNGKKLVWSGNGRQTGYIILLTGIIAAILIPVSGKRNENTLEKQKRESMMLDYPNIIDKLVLLLNAGLSSRMAVKKIALDYKKTRSDNDPVKWGYEEIFRAYSDMNLGIPEKEAYINMGNRVPLPQYKTLSSLLVQNLLRGSRELIGILEEEAKEAFEDRKKNARAAGERAGTKLLFPMLMMLGMILIILIIPAFMSFM